MTFVFDDAVVTAVLAHMNDDHTDDNLLIARAFAPSFTAVTSTMIGFDGERGQWRIATDEGEEHTIEVPWPGGAISERPEVRREIVALYDEACARLNITPRPHA
ncbi:DUF2470 domain-containing protein [Microbacterium sp. C7(2022)]|uniref:DUF2470 domain-containing protein n=1 Tax=Microbacterium sp. C7(2022) TaxID=2992759 RepID=UPI00237A56E0|nr:DUF2470 domain-containing protein [Microbacterium sp. C7(2022)]MDE0546401.1 DUF2470 domain-containing protein [Microbacterium sp. C7(2022)]